MAESNKQDMDVISKEDKGMAESNKQDMDGISREDKEEIEYAFEKGGLKELKILLETKRDEWKTTEVHIAVTGASGVGKSSLINTFRGLTADDEEGANANVKEETMEVKSYKHPKHNNIVIWDLPGVGTLNFPQETYLKRVEFERYDCFLVLSVGRCREGDIWLCNAVQKFGKTFYFVRTQMQLEVLKDRLSHPKTHDKKKVVQIIRDDCAANLKKAKLPSDRIFLIDSYEIYDNEFDFDELSKHIVDELPIKKKEALTLSMNVLTRGIIERKKNILISRIYKVALLSAVGGAVPIPEVNAMIDAALVKAEIEEYRNQFGITSKIHVAQTGKNKPDLLQSFIADANPAALAQFIAKYSPDEEKLGTMKFSFGIRIIASIAGAAISYGKTVFALRAILDTFTDNVYSMSQEIVNSFAPSM